MTALRMLLFLFGLAAFAPLATAGDAVRLTDDQERALTQVMGGPAMWGALPEWRRRMIRERFARYVACPEPERERIRAHGLKQWLIQPERRMHRDELPEAIQRQIRDLAPPLRPQALRVAMLRLRHLRLDRSLQRVPRRKRWALWRRLFPEPFDPARARDASEDLKRLVAKDVAREIRERHGAELKGLGKVERRQRLARLVEVLAQAEENAIVNKLRRELARVYGRGGPRFVGRGPQRRGYFVLEHARIATPRQRELLRYLLAPEECPLLDLGFLGPRPAGADARREWERDFHLFARLELLGEAGVNREMLLHLAASGSPEDLVRAFQALREAR